MALFVLNYWLRELSLSAIANRFELRCQQPGGGYFTLGKTGMCASFG